MDVGVATFRLLALSQIVLFAAAVLTSRAPWLRRLLLSLLALTVAAYLVLPLGAAARWPTGLLGGLGVLATLCPLALLLVVLDLFEERAFDGWVNAFGAACVVLAIAQAVTAGGPLGAAIAVAMHLVKVGLVGVAGFLLWRGRRFELVELRLRMRGGLVLVIGIVALVVLALEWAFSWHVPVGVELPGMASIFVLALAVNLAFWRLDPGLALAAMPLAETEPVRSLEGQVPPAGSAYWVNRQEVGEVAAASGTDARSRTDGEGLDPLLARIDALMRSERLHADHDLRIATLAARLGVPEYRVRRAINAGLGFRNFNHFVNSFRIDEASHRLRSERHLPVLSIALDVGFRSMSSFSVAFRERHGCTPGEFRSAGAPDS